MAQSEGYADDFSQNSLRYSAGADTNSAGNGTAEIVDDGVRLTVDAPAGNNDYLYFNAAATGDEFAATVTMDSATGDIGGGSGIWLEATLFNGTADFAGGNGSQEGDVYAAITLDFFGNGGRQATLCLSLQSDDGNGNPYPGFGSDGNSCEPFDDFLPELGAEYTLSVSLDREASTLVATIDEQEKVVPITTPVFAAGNPRRQLQLVRFEEGTAVATVHGVASEGFADDFRADPIVLAPYQIPFDPSGEEGTVTIADGRARFDVASDGDFYRQATLRFVQDRLPDHLEADMTMSSNSTVPATGRVGARVQGVLYNDTAEGGFNGREGAVYGSVELTFRGNGGRSAEYCLARSDDADGQSRTTLLDTERDCLNFGFLPELDTAYQLRLVLDREAGQVTFAIDDEVRVHDIATPILDAGDNRFRELVVYADDQSVAVGFADDLRTAADAMTAEETAAANAPMEGTDPVEMETESDTEGTTAGDTDGDAGTDAPGMTDMTMTPVMAMTPGTTDSAGSTDPVTPTSGGGSSGSGGGCSITSGGQRDPVFGLLALLAIVGVARRRRRA